MGELQFGRIQLGLVRLHRALQLAHQGLLRLHLLACNRVFFQQTLVALQIELRIAQLRHIARQLSFGLGQLSLGIAVIDLGQHIARAHHLPLRKPQGFEFAIDLGAHHRGVQGRQGANGLDGLAHVHALHLGRADGLVAPTAKAPTLGTAPFALALGLTRHVGGHGTPIEVPSPGTGQGQREHGQSHITPRFSGAALG